MTSQGQDEKSGQKRKDGEDSGEAGFNGEGKSLGGDVFKPGPIEIANKKTFGLPSTVQSHLLDSKYYENTLSNMKTLEDLLEEVRTYVRSVEPYMPDSITMPSPFFGIVYRLFTLGLDSRQMQRLLESTVSPYIRCMGFVHLRFGLASDRLWAWLGEFVMDDEEFQPNAGATGWTTIGDFVEALLIKEKYYNTLLPRVSGGIRRQLEERLAPVATYRKRMKANRALMDVYRKKGTRVEVCINGSWHTASVVDLDDHPSRPKVLVTLAGGSREETVVHLGKVILCDEVPRSLESNSSLRLRSRSRSREGMDWSRCKGKSDAELVEELRQAERERAVCTSGKAYGRRPSTFDKGLAQPREGQGSASRQLLEEETFIKARAEKRNASPERASVANSAPSVEHQERMRQLFEKYGNVRDPSKKGGKDEKRSLDIEGPDIMRLG